MENERILELKITEQDLYFLSHIEAIKENAGIFKEKYNKYMWGILKKYNINSIDFLQISKYVRNQKLHLKPELVEKYGPYQLEKSKVDYDFNGMKTYAVIAFAIIIVIVFFKNNSNSSSNSTTTEVNNNLETFENNRKQAIIHRCGREWFGERDETYGIYGDYCCLRCYADFYPN